MMELFLLVPKSKAQARERDSLSCLSTSKDCWKSLNCGCFLVWSGVWLCSRQAGNSTRLLHNLQRNGRPPGAAACGWALAGASRVPLLKHKLNQVTPFLPFSSFHSCSLRLKSMSSLHGLLSFTVHLFFFLQPSKEALQMPHPPLAMPRPPGSPESPRSSSHLLSQVSLGHNLFSLCSPTQKRQAESPLSPRSFLETSCTALVHTWGSVCRSASFWSGLPGTETRVMSYSFSYLQCLAEGLAQSVQ